MQDDANHKCEIEGQLSAKEREYLTNAVMGAPRPPRVVLEVGTWLGGGSTIHILRALEQNRQGHLWGIEAL
jgi:predicted O-methyltransferase YrrM